MFLCRQVRINLHFDAVLARQMFFQHLICPFLLGPPFAMISTEITVLANAMSIVRPINVGALVRWFFPASRVVAVLTHAFCVKL